MISVAVSEMISNRGYASLMSSSIWCCKSSQLLERGHALVCLDDWISIVSMFAIDIDDSFKLSVVRPLYGIISLTQVLWYIQKISFIFVQDRRAKGKVYQIVSSSTVFFFSLVLGLAIGLSKTYFPKLTWSFTMDISSLENYGLFFRFSFVLISIHQQFIQRVQFLC